jgi:PAS domain S-box-containing protein
MAGNESAFGLDAAAHPELVDALQRARATGQPTASDLVDLVQDRAAQASFEFVMPVYKADRQLAGDTAAIIRGRDLVRTILAGAGLLDDQAIALSVYAGGLADPARLMYSSTASGKPLPRDALAAWLAPDYTGRVAGSFTVAGRTWLVQASAAPRPFLPDHLGSLSMLVGGVLFTLLMTAFVQAATERARKVQQLVRDRTADLKRTNLRLVEDVIARRRTERALQESEQRFRQLVAMSSDWYWEQDRELRFTSITGDFANKAGIQAARLLGKTRWECVPGLEQSETGLEHIAKVRSHQPFQDFEYQTQDDNGDTRWFSISGQPLFDDTGAFIGYRGTGSDITPRKLTEQRVYHVAQHDVLTGLPNRSLLQDRLGQALAYAARSNYPVWVMMIDLDRFKFVNDSMGHKAGDCARRCATPTRWPACPVTSSS